MTLDDLTLTALLDQTRADAGSTDPLDLLGAAARMQQDLSDIGDQLLDHWVQHARTAGCSWAQIGSALGVSKQAAQQRHSATGSGRGVAARLRDAMSGMFTRFTTEARAVVVHSQEEARSLDHASIGTEHLLLGVLAVPGAVPALAEAGVTLEGARTDLEALSGRGTTPSAGHIPFDSAAKAALEASVEHTRRLGDDHIGPRHVLLGVLADHDGTAARLLLGRDIDLDALITAVES